MQWRGRRGGTLWSRNGLVVQNIMSIININNLRLLPTVLKRGFCAESWGNEKTPILLGGKDDTSNLKILRSMLRNWQHR